MRRPSLAFAALLGAISALPFMAIAYLANAVLGLSFVPFALFDWLARVTPGGLVTLGIDTMVAVLVALGLSVSETAKFAEQLMALVMVILLGAVLGTIVAIMLRQEPQSPMRAGLTGAAPLFFLFVLAEAGLPSSGNLFATVLWLAVLTGGWGLVLASFLKRRLLEERTMVEERRMGEYDQSRRDALLKLTGAAAGLTLGAWGLARLARADTASIAQESGASQPLPTAVESTRGTPAAGAGTADIPPTPSGRIQPPPGVRPEITSNEDFYRIDINTRPPVIDGSSWQLIADGLFENPRGLTINDLMAFPAITQPITLSCISNRVGGDLIGTSYWTGVRLRDLLDDLGLQPEAGALQIEADDGFYETVIAEDMMDERTLLVYGMNGETLPVEHGFPLRIFIPNRYGMKQPKWIVRMEAIEAWRPGYWVERGWSREARPQIVSVIDSVATDSIDDSGRVPVGGIAWAGDRGIQKVELRVDDGPWMEAQLRTPPISNLTWVQWRYDWPAESGRHRFTVRATDGDGLLQTDAINDPHPDGATGYHSLNTTI